MSKRDPEPFLWLLFSAGGVMSAMLMPAVLILLGVAFPLGWLQPPTYEHMRTVLGNPIAFVVVLSLCVLSLFHWAHRFRHTLYDALKLKHLSGVITPLCYLVVLAASGVAGVLLWRLL